MFDGFEEQKDEQARKRWFASAGTSAAVYVVLGGIVAVIAGRTVVKQAAPEQIDVTFRADVEPPPPEPPPPPPPPPRTRVATATRKPGRPLVEPTKVSDTRAEDVADGAAIDPETLGGEGGDAVKPVPPPPPPPPPEPIKPPAPVDVADDFEPPRPVEGNRPPIDPDAERRRGLEADVTLRVAVSDAGDVTDVTVVAGLEPFLTAAIEAVRTWRYWPAREGERTVPGTRIVRIPFRIRV